jgi:hypothetical protein
MSNVIHRTTFKYLESVNTPDYPAKDWLHNPDLSLVSGVSPKYWKVDGDTVVEMSVAEKEAKDAETPVRKEKRSILTEMLVNASDKDQANRFLDAMDNNPSFLAALELYDYKTALDRLDKAVKATAITQADYDKIATMIPTVLP